MITQTSTRQIEPDITVVEITGRLALGNLLQSFETSILRLILGGARKMIVDLSALSYVDSSGIGVLLGCHGEMVKVGGRMRLAGARGLVAQSFEVVHLNQVVPLDADLASACAALGESGAAA